ncbi:hypothetical protein LTR99_001664 [Exophiala xenobiotica]|uniref:C2H2-type domain-containing protein n=1 Tax=Vermiconidia calcicola TaxID=1690605 RepID=A0AAV9QIJ6_9PEZI|nr:hypothetical protein LTR92_009000 [Exophiala xenobiotica]KAK5544174.1 hypothetical protein LTR25_001789 [Vermiconidia calcicola]KAK5289698.1 hypothetical protein LTR14_007336 [Exophiala xenobiotica]KAK5308688.1 hypothetical protein LTR99_001664 [Exophiala xenobiotica]KAK5326797.1 hypothetical protein LTR93_003660 [Exophiala xenobiotica]
MGFWDKLLDYFGFQYPNTEAEPVLLRTIWDEITDGLVDDAAKSVGSDSYNESESEKDDAYMESENENADYCIATGNVQVVDADNARYTKFEVAIDIRGRFLCPFADCERRYFDENAILDHMDVKYPCTMPDCQEEFQNYRSLTAHMKSHQRGYIFCPIHGCFYKGKTERGIKQHYRVMHNDLYQEMKDENRVPANWSEWSTRRNSKDKAGSVDDDDRMSD